MKQNYLNTRYFLQRESDPDLLVLACPDCSNKIVKRSDAFLPGLHMAICVSCSFSTDQVMLLDGSMVGKSAESYLDGS